MDIGSEWDQFKFVDGVKHYRCECKICGAEYYHKNPYSEVCKDKPKHTELRLKRKEENAWRERDFRRKPQEHDFQGSGSSWDNAVKTLENS